MICRTIFSLVMLMGVASAASAGEFVDLTVGQSNVIRVAGAPATVIIGDNRVADAAMGSGSTIILTAHALGTTNLIVLDESGSQILSSTLQVGPLDRRPRTTIRISRGLNTEEYVCGPGSGCVPNTVGIAAPNTFGNAAAASMAGTFDPCIRPTDTAADGLQCGGRAASLRPGGVDGEGQPEARPQGLAEVRVRTE